MAPAQASPFVRISTNQFKTQPLPVHLTVELTIVFNPYYDSVGANFIHSPDILYTDCNRAAFFYDLGGTQKDIGTAFLKQALQGKFILRTFKLTLKLQEYLSNFAYLALQASTFES